MRPRRTSAARPSGLCRYAIPLPNLVLHHHPREAESSRSRRWLRPSPAGKTVSQVSARSATSPFVRPQAFFCNLLPRCGMMGVAGDGSWLRGRLPESSPGATETRESAVSVTAKAFLDLLEPIRHALLSYARRASSRPDEAFDLLQQATMVAWREFARFAPGSNFKAWMFRILVNTVYSDNKRVRRDAGRVGVDVDPKDLAEDLTVAIEQEEAWYILQDNPARLSELMDQRLAEALGGLTEGPKQALLLRSIGEFSYREISVLLAMPVGTVMSHVHRARRDLRQQLSQFALDRGWVADAAGGVDDALS